eukprot:492561-Prorocentrum_minimum.AAC.1
MSTGSPAPLVCSNSSLNSLAKLSTDTDAEGNASPSTSPSMYKLGGSVRSRKRIPPNPLQGPPEDPCCPLQTPAPSGAGARNAAAVVPFGHLGPPPGPFPALAPGNPGYSQRR